MTRRALAMTIATAGALCAAPLCPGRSRAEGARSPSPLYAAGAEVEPGGVRFEFVDVYADSGGAPLAAYQIELVVERGDAAIVGVEGGEHPAFAPAPRYDPEALSRGRIVIAAFDTGDNLPAGRTRIARLHMRTEGPERPRYALRVQAAADREGERITIQATTDQGDAR